MSKTKILSLKEYKIRLSNRTYEKYLKVINNEAQFNDEDIKEIIEMIIKFAKENNAKQFAHLFFPLSLKLSCKYTSLSKIDNDETFFSFDINELIKEEIDISSIINSKDISNTKGYLYWDYYSSIFIRDKILYIPCFLIDSNNSSYDIKYPLRKSSTYISSACKKLCDLLSYKSVQSITPLSGLEIEYYLLTKEEIKDKNDNSLHNFYFEEESNNKSHYLHIVKPYIKDFMDEIDKELLSLNILVKVEHNEVSKNQYELVLYYSDCNKTFEYNYLIMHLLNEIAEKHHLVCILNEKPFHFLNGSGKHNNYSLITNTRINLFNSNNFNIYIITIASLIKAINNNEALLSLALASPSNYKRLGEKEAPSKIISLSLSDELISYFENDNSKINQELNFSLYAKTKLLLKDNSRRNRSSPICILNNKIEYRGLGSSMSEGLLNTIINTILGEAIESTINEIKKESLHMEQDKAIKKIVTKIYNENKRIIYNSSCYENEYYNYAKENNLLILNNIDEVISYIIKNKSYSILCRHNIMTEEEIKRILDYILSTSNDYQKEEGIIMLDTFKNKIIPSINSIISQYEINKALSKEIENRIDRLHEFIKESYKTLFELEDIIYNHKDDIQSISSLKDKLLINYRRIQKML